jgi:hypothetical protein
MLLIPSNDGGDKNFSDGGRLTPINADGELLAAIPRAVLLEGTIEDSIVFLSSSEAIRSGGGLWEFASFLASSNASGSGKSSSGSAF